ncbi:hypothetical protein FO519_006236 [Halicephalobus sp. NKZ332]|nr:hypothetical protein FO519_006236 [Halicephalobus sp. NKZ332]
MDINLDDLITGVSIHPKKPNLLAVGIGDSITFLEHETKKNEIYQTRSIGIGNFAKDLTFSPDGEQVCCITSEREMRIFDAELNLKRRYKFDEDAFSIGQPVVNGSKNHIGIDVLVGFDSGKLYGYDTRANSIQPAIKLENHSNSVNVIRAADWWGCVTVADDGFIVLNDFRNKNSKKSEYGVLEGLPRDVCICPFSKKTVVCTYESVYVFHSYDLDSGPILKTGPAFANKMPAAALNLSTHEHPDLFGISYVDAPYITLLDTARHMWTRRYGTRRIGIDLFAFPDRKTHGYVYFSGEDSYLCVRKMDDVREDCDQVLNFKIKNSARIESKTKGKMDFSGLVDNSDEGEMEDLEARSFEDYMEKIKEEDTKKTEEERNPQIEVGEDEEVLFDSDEEPEYLSKVVEKSLEDYNSKDLEDINVKLMKAGIGSLLENDDEQMDKLYNLLTDEEKKTFTKLAEAIHYDEMLTRLSPNFISVFGRCLSSAATASNISESHVVDTAERQSFVKEKIKEALTSKEDNRLFAVVFAHNRQFKVSQNDLIQLHHNSFVDIGQKIQLEKVLLVGGKDFTLFGRPTLDPQLVKVYATVVEKTTTSPELYYLRVSGKKVRAMRWLSHELTVLRVNEIEVNPKVLGN